MLKAFEELLNGKKLILCTMFGKPAYVYKEGEKFYYKSPLKKLEVIRISITPGEIISFMLENGNFTFLRNYAEYRIEEMGE